MKVRNLYVGRLACKMMCFWTLMSLGPIVFAQPEARFFMEIDTTLNGIYAGQEFDLKYRCTVRFDSVIPPDFGDRMEVVKGPVTNRSMSTVVINGEKTQVMEDGFSYHVRFLSEGMTDLPVAQVKIGTEVYETPPLAVRVKPAIRDIQGVECTLSTRPWQGENIRVVLTCNRRPDGLTPLLKVHGKTYLPSGSGSGVSLKKGDGADAAKVKESYEFYYNIPSGGGRKDVYRVENLNFGGIPYSFEKIRRVSGDGDKGWIVAVIVGCAAIFGGMWLRFRKEAGEGMAEFVLEHKRLNLSTEWALTHYGFPLFLGCIPFFFVIINGYDYLVGDRSGLFFPWFWCGLLPAVLAIAFWRNQRSKLGFRSVATSLSAGVLREVVEETARENDWTIDHSGEDCIVAHTHPHGLSATWGEQVFVVFDRGQVWLNSVNDLNKRSAAFSFGYTKKNIDILEEAITKNRTRGRGNCAGF